MRAGVLRRKWREVLFLGFFAAVFVGAAVHELYGAYLFDEDTLETTGTVTSYLYPGAREGEVVFEFDAAGKTYRANSPDAGVNRVRIGSKVTVHYRRLDPQNARIYSWGSYYGGAAWALFIGLLALGPLAGYLLGMSDDPEKNL